MKETSEKNGRVFAYNKHINQSKKALECHALDWNYFLHIFPHWEDIPRSLLHVLAVKINQNWGKHPPQSRANAIIDIWATQMTTPQRHSLSALTDPCLHQRDINADKLWSWNRCASQSAGAMNAVILESSASAPNALWKVQLGRNKGNLCLVKIKWDLLYPADTIGNHHRKTSERKTHHLTHLEKENTHKYNCFPPECAWVRTPRIAALRSPACRHTGQTCGHSHHEQSHAGCSHTSGKCHLAFGGSHDSPRSTYRKEDMQVCR